MKYLVTCESGHQLTVNHSNEQGAISVARSYGWDDAKSAKPVELEQSK